MSTSKRVREVPVGSIEELIRTVRRESAAAMSTAQALWSAAPRQKRVDLPRRFPAPDGVLDDPETGTRTAAPAAPDHGRTR